MNLRLLLRSALIVAVFSGTVSDVASSIDYPIKPLTIIVPFSPGGSADVQARLIAKGLSKRLGKPVVIDNRPGASGTIGASLASRAPADGYTLLHSNFSMLVSEPILHRNSGINPQRDFAPVTLTTEQPLVLVVPRSVPVRDLGDLIAQARKQPGKFSYASWGPGSSAHLAGEMFQSATQVKLLHIPYKGIAPAITDMVGGHVSMMFSSPFGTMPHVRAGRLRALAVTGKTRMRALPDTPTFSEAGVQGLDLRVWTCLLVPVRTPNEIVERLHTEIVAVLASPDFARAAEDDGVVVVGSSPEQLAQRIRSDVTFFEKLVKTLNLRGNE